MWLGTTDVIVIVAFMSSIITVLMVLLYCHYCACSIT